MADSRARQRRLLSLLPRIIAEQPKNSPVDVLIRAMAQALAELDEAMARTQRDHWLGLAQGRTPADEAIAILERLGPYLGVVKQDSETPETYRLRLMRIDRIRLSSDGQTEFLLEDACRSALSALVSDTQEQLATDLQNLTSDDEDGIRLVLRDRWNRLAGKDLQLKEQTSAWTFPLPAGHDQLPQKAGEQWEALLSACWMPALKRHWSDLARDDDAVNLPDALGRLGALFGIARLRRRHRKTGDTAEGYVDIIEIREEIEAFRQRIRHTAYILGNGLISPRALLELTIVTLGAEACSETLVDRDTVVAYGVPLAAKKSCTVCNSGVSAPCPKAKQRILQASITDNPLLQQSWQPAQALHPGGNPFLIKNTSLTSAVPELRLKAAEQQAIRYPYLQNRDTGEIMLYAGEIGPGEVLSLRPQVDPEECEPFISHDGINVYRWRKQYPSGIAVVIDANGNERNVSARICFLTGTRFPDADVANDSTDAPRYAAFDAREGVRFADALSQGDCFGKAKFDESHFGSSGQRVRMPRLLPGNNQWTYGVYNRKNVEAIVGNNPGDLLESAPLSVEDVPAVVALSWWTRPPAEFRLRIPKNDWLSKADERGAIQHLAHLVQNARAAGVTATIDFPEPTQREHHTMEASAKLGVKHNRQEQHDLHESELEWQGHLLYKESQTLSVGPLLWRGVFDVTRLDGSRFD